MNPAVSVVVRSYNRLEALCELVERLLAQRHPSFEVVVVEQSTRATPAHAARLAALEGDPRLRVLRHPPLGGARARNVGVGEARGELILFIDDDDLPVGDRWIDAHAARFADPRCLGVSGRHRLGADDPRPYGRRVDRAFRRCQMFSPLLKMPWAYVRQDRPKAPVDQVHGTNSSLRRSAIDRFGGWDEDTPIEDEASFGYRAARGKRPEEYFCFDPAPVIERRLDVEGGLDKRYITAARSYAKLLTFVHRIIGRYHPWRVRALYPLYLLAVYVHTVDWIFTESNRYRTLARRVVAAAVLLVRIPEQAIRVALSRGPSAPRSSGTGSLSRSTDPAPRNASTGSS